MSYIVPYRQEKQAFPVKLTDPVTAILYITSDPRHMEELKHTIHVKEIALGVFSVQQQEWLHYAVTIFFVIVLPFTYFILACIGRLCIYMLFEIQWRKKLSGIPVIRRTGSKKQITYIVLIFRRENLFSLKGFVVSRLYAHL